MIALPFSSTRTFVVVSYAASHGLLLLRSRRTKDHPMRIDILFQDVRAVEMRFWFDGIVIEAADTEFLRAFASNAVAMVEPGNRVYSLRGDGWRGYVLAGILRTHEDHGDFDAPSALL